MTGGAATAPRRPLCELLSNGVYLTTVLSLCCLFFVVNGIQFWVTKYIINVIGMEQNAVAPAFAVVSNFDINAIMPVGCVAPGITFFEKLAIVAFSPLLLNVFAYISAYRATRKRLASKQLIAPGPFWRRTPADWNLLIKRVALNGLPATISILLIIYPPISDLDEKQPPPSAVRGPSGWIYRSTSFCCLRPHHFPRRLAIWVIEHPLFDPLILLTIMCNCTTMAWASPLDPPGTEKEALLAKLEWIYLYIFTFELSVKMIGYGVLFHPDSYLRDAWCQLDFVVVVSLRGSSSHP